MARHIVATLARLSFIIIIVQAGICILGLLWLKTMYMKFGKLLECISTLNCTVNTNTIWKLKKASYMQCLYYVVIVRVLYHFELEA